MKMDQQRKILIRFDDICPTMNWEEWGKAEKILKKYNVKPLLGIIPDCRDPELQIDTPREDYWGYLHELRAKGYVLAMHGYEHIYDSKYRGMVNLGFKSEFAGHPYEIQLDKIRKGKKVLEEHGIKTEIFFAPSHSYDKNTLKALYENGFKYISDGKSSGIIARNGIKCVPCRCGGVPLIKRTGLYTAVFHAHEWVRSDKKTGYLNLVKLCEEYEQDLCEFYELVKAYGDSSQLFQRIDEWIIVLYERFIRIILSRCKHILFGILGR